MRMMKKYLKDMYIYIYIYTLYIDIYPLRYISLEKRKIIFDFVICGKYKKFAKPKIS